MMSVDRESVVRAVDLLLEVAQEVVCQLPERVAGHGAWVNNSTRQALQAAIQRAIPVVSLLRMGADLVSEVRCCICGHAGVTMYAVVVGPERGTVCGACIDQRKHDEMPWPRHDVARKAAEPSSGVPAPDQVKADLRKKLAEAENQRDAAVAAQNARAVEEQVLREALALLDGDDVHNADVRSISRALDVVGAARHVLRRAIGEQVVQ